MDFGWLWGVNVGSSVESTMFSSVQCSHDPMDCSTPGISVHHQLPAFTQTLVLWVGDAIQPSHPLLSPSPPTFIFPSIRVFSNESVLHIRWPKYWSFSFSISPFNEYSGLISFRIDWLDLLAVQGTFQSRLQHHSSKASILQRSANPSQATDHDLICKSTNDLFGFFKAVEKPQSQPYTGFSLTCISIGLLGWETIAISLLYLVEGYSWWRFRNHYSI